MERLRVSGLLLLMHGRSAVGPKNRKPSSNLTDLRQPGRARSGLVHDIAV